MNQEEEIFDNLFFTIIQKSGGLTGFWDNAYSFLRRRTDFFTNKSEAENIITKYCQKHYQIFEQEAKLKEKKEAELSEKKKNTDKVAEAMKKVKEEEEIRKKAEEQLKKEQALKGVSEKLEENEDDKVEEGKLRPVNNGSTTDKYTWTQSLEEVQIFIPIGEDVKAKFCKVNLTPNTMEVFMKGELYVKGELSEKIVVDESIWIIDDGAEGRFLHITLNKWPNSMSWWECVLKGDPKIDTQKVNPETSTLSDLDGETRGTVEKMMFDMRQKQAGKPSSDDLLKMDKLKPFMAAHPEMDFSNMKFN